MNVNELPDEMLCSIFDELDVYELKLASLVCRRWADLTFSGRRMDRVWLVNRDCNCAFFSNFKRNYRNVRQPCETVTVTITDDQMESLLRLLHTLKPHVRMLDIQTGVSSQQLVSILLEIPTLQHLSIDGNNIEQKYRKNNATFRVLPELKSPNRRQLSSFFRTNIPNLQSLTMNCSTGLELDAWKALSGELKLVNVNDLDETYLRRFLELTFPRLENLTINVFEFSMNEKMDLGRCADFFRRHPLLRRLSLYDGFPAKLIQTIVHHCPELTHLCNVIVDVPEDGILESLVRLTKLKYLTLVELYRKVDRKIFRGALKSLESVQLEAGYLQVLLENLYEVVPRLSCLKITEEIYCADLQFICEKFSHLRSLELYISSEFLLVADDSVRIDKLLHLQELKLSGNIKNRSIHRNNVRCLTRSSSGLHFQSVNLPEDELDQIPVKFPLLERFIIEYCSVSVAAIEGLQKLVPSCRIDYYDNKRFYPIAYVTAV